MQKILYLCKRKQAISRIRFRMLAFAWLYAVTGGIPAYQRGMAVMDGTACYLEDKPIGEG